MKLPNAMVTTWTALPTRLPLLTHNRWPYKSVMGCRARKRGVKNLQRINEYFRSHTWSWGSQEILRKLIWWVPILTKQPPDHNRPILPLLFFPLLGCPNLKLYLGGWLVPQSTEQPLTSEPTALCYNDFRFIVWSASDVVITLSGGLVRN